LYVNHDPFEGVAGVDGVKRDWVGVLGLRDEEVNGDGDRESEKRDGERRLVHFKFEPMVS
jgi:hypothetical protein